MGGTDDQQFQARTFASEDGLTLYLRDYDPGSSVVESRLPVVCLPGLTRNARDFHQLAVMLSRDCNEPRRVIALDYRGRGLSDWDENKANYNLAVEAGDVIQACAFLGISRAAFIGTSRGGLIVHVLATVKPELLVAVIFNDIGPVIEAEGLMQIRDDLNSATPPKGWDEAALLLKARHGSHFPALSDGDWHEMANAIYREIEGRIVADVDPAIAAQLMTIDFGRPLADLWRQYQAFTDIPMLVVRGENSALLSETTVEEMQARHPHLRVLCAHGQGHPPLLHLSAVAHEIAGFLASV
jgi:pimeloyl-ACP methyl ester carboxylesterase